MLTFPDLRPEDFAPWINEGDAQKQGLSVSDFAAQQAELYPVARTSALLQKVFGTPTK